MKEKRRKEKEKECEENRVKRQRREEETMFKEQNNQADCIRKAVAGRLAPIKFTCGVCGERGRLNDQMNDVMWYGCKERVCERWYHEEVCGRESIQQRAWVLGVSGIVRSVSHGFMTRNEYIKMGMCVDVRSVLCYVIFNYV